MSIKEIIGSTAELIIKVVALIFAVTYIIRASTAAYDYGYRIFTEEPSRSVRAESSASAWRNRCLPWK